MSELAMVLLLSSGVLLWMVGGTWWRPARVFVWPVVAGGLLLLSQIMWWKAALASLTLVGVNSLPYGQKCNWLGRAFVFGLYAVPALWLGAGTLLFSIPLLVISLLSLLWASRKLNWVTWKIWEAEAGLLQAASLVMGALKHG